MYCFSETNKKHPSAIWSLHPATPQKKEKVYLGGANDTNGTPLVWYFSFSTELGLLGHRCGSPLGKNILRKRKPDGWNTPKWWWFCYFFFLKMNYPKNPDHSIVAILRTRTPGIQVQTPPLEGPRILRAVKSLLWMGSTIRNSSSSPQSWKR